jgi:hypothetical protein
MWLQNGTIIKTPRTLTIDNVTYPSAVFRDTDLLATLGITPYSEVKVNQRYYWEGELTVTDGVGTYAEIDRDVDQLKEGMLSTINSQVSSIQGGIDWYWSRASKGGKAVPAAIKKYAATIYAEQVTKEAEVTALTTLEDVIAYENTPYTEVRKVKVSTENGDGTVTESYGPDTEESTREINMTMHWTTNPKDDVDPAFVSLIETV